MTSFYDSLIREIKSLYSIISLAILHKRISDYHSHTDYSEHAHAGDIKSLLITYIDKIPVSTAASQQAKFSADGVIQKEPVVDKYLYESHETDTARFVSHKYVGDLSKYFKSRRKVYELQPGIKDKLEHSVWEHINASIQCAYRGNIKNAQMHADIANSAFKEVAHYMSVAEYNDFSKKVTVRMTAL